LDKYSKKSIWMVYENVTMASDLKIKNVIETTIVKGHSGWKEHLMFLESIGISLGKFDLTTWDWLKLFGAMLKIMLK